MLFHLCPLSLKKIGFLPMTSKKKSLIFIHVQKPYSMHM